MNEELTNEAVEMLDLCTKYGKNEILKYLIELGGIVSKEIKPNSEGIENTYYIFSGDRNLFCYNPIVSDLAKEQKYTIDRKLTKEAAELIGQYIKGGEADIMISLLSRGGVVRKETEPVEKSGRKIGSERILYYYPDGGYATYDPVRLKIAKRLK